MPRKIEISHKTIIFTIVFLLGLWFLYQVRQMLLALFIAVVLMSALNPLVDRFERFHFPRWLAILSLYILILGIFGTILGVITPLLVDQTTAFINRIGFYLQAVRAFGLDPNLIASQFSQLGLIPTNILKTIVDFFSNIISFLFVAVVTFYLLLERKNLTHYLTILFGERRQAQAEEFVNKVEKQLGGWVRGEAILMTIIGIIIFLGLKLLGIDFALPLAILAGLLEIVPNFGPIISAVPALLAAFTISPWMVLAVAALYFLVQQIENSLIVPKVMQKVVGVNPLVTILSLAVGFKLAGAVGAILAIPIVLVLQIIVSGIFHSERFREL